MSTSCNDTADELTPVVEAFPYHDTLGPSTASDAATIYPAENVPGKAGASAGKPGRITQEEVSRLVAEARQEGLAEGVRQAAARFEAELATERKRVAESVAEFQRQCTDYFSRVEIELVHLSLAIAAKILHRESQVDRMVVAGLVKAMLDKFQQNTRVVVRVRPEDEQSWANYFRESTNLEIVGDPTLEPKACFIETELGVANMALDAQLKEVETGFFDLLAQRPNPK
jgi:flagellar assembly protein FliH